MPCGFISQIRRNVNYEPKELMKFTYTKTDKSLYLKEYI